MHSSGVFQGGDDRVSGDSDHRRKRRFCAVFAPPVHDALLHPEEWENRTVPEYLEQVANWIEDFSESPANDIDWDNMEFRTLARMLYMGKLYE